ncbi:MAG TPA: tyrosine-type recombinase/integrase [Gammaproteobacteria bacterium]|nr:tyrosine-type recombinase/integrase [Gammaproteobacteria bacterium]
MAEQNKINFTKAVLDSLALPAIGKRSYYYDTKMRGLGISITSTGTKSFIIYRWVNSKPERVTLGRYPDLSIEQARRKAIEINAAIAKGENPNDKRRADRAEISLEALFVEYLDRYAKLHKSSWQVDQMQFQRYLVPWKKRKLSSISKSDIQRLHQDIGRENGHYAANRLLALLSVMFNKAIEFGLWDKINPALGIKKFREQTRDRFLQADELPRFFSALAEEPNDTIRDYFILSLLTGARRTNLLTMKWEQVDLTRGEWYIPHTKNKTPQIVTLTPEAIVILQQRQASATNEYVFPTDSRAGHLVEPKRGWERILEKAGISNLRIHDLRRTLGSWQARTGASLAIIGKSLNHKSPQATAVYARLDLDPVRASVNKATKAIFQAAGIKPIIVNEPQKIE